MLRLRLLMAIALLLAAAGARAADYCVNPVTGSDTASGLCSDRPWATLGPSQSFPFVSGDRVLISAGRHVHPLTGWFMKPGVSWIGAGRELTTVVYDKAVAVPFVRFRTGTAGSGPPSDLRPGPFTNATVFSDMTLQNIGMATVGIDIACTSGDSAPTIARVGLNGFATGMNLHPSSDERVAASTHAVITNSIIRGARDAGLQSFADVFYGRAITEGSTITNVAAEVAGVGARVKTLINDMRDAGMPSASPVLTNLTLAGSGEAALLLVSYYDNGTAEQREQRNAGSTAATIRGCIVTGSAGHGIREHSPFTEPAAVQLTAMGGNALGDYLDEGTTVRAATAVGTGNLSVTPAFVDRTAGDLHQLASSPTINQMPSAQAPANDYDGQSRPQQAQADMGADEWVPCAAVADATATRSPPPCTGGPTTLDGSRSTIDAACVPGMLYEWFDGPTSIGTSVTLDVSPAVATTYRLRVRCADPALSACFGETTIRVEPSTPPPTAAAGDDQEACAARGESVVFALAGSGGATPPSTLASQRWTSTGGTIADPAAATTTLTVAADGTNQVVTATFTITDSEGCTAQDSVTLTVHPEPTVAIVAPATECAAASGPDVTIGVLATDTGGTPPITHAWTTSEGSIAGDGAALLTLPPSDVVRIVDVGVTATDAEGCTATDTAQIQVIPQPVADAGADGQACGETGTDASAPLDGSGSTGPAPLTYAWSAPEGTIADPAAAVTSISMAVGAAPRTVTVTLEVRDATGACRSTDTRDVVVGPGPTANAGADTDHCAAPGSLTVPLDGTASAGQPPLAYSWSASEGVIANPAAATTSIDVTVGAVSRTVIVTLEVTDARGTCRATDQRLITVGPGPAADAGADTQECVAPGTAVVPLDASASSGEPPLTYAWTSTGGRIASPSSATTTLSIDVGSVSEVVTATVEVRDARGTCVGTDERVIRLSPRATASPGGPYSVLQSPVSTRIPIDGAFASGEEPLTLAWTTDLGTFEDTGTTTSALAAPALVVPEQPVVQRGQVCLTVTTTSGCNAGPECADVVVLLVPVDPPEDVSPTLRLRKGPPDDVVLSWQEAPVDATHDAATGYELLIGDTGCGPFSRLQRLPAQAGANETTDPILWAAPRYRCYWIRSTNDGGASVPPPDGSTCR